MATSTRIAVVHERSEKVAAMFEGAMDAPAWVVVEWACMACCEWEAAVSMVAVVDVLVLKSCSLSLGAKSPPPAWRYRLKAR